MPEFGISPDRRLIYTLPPEVPIGRVKLIIQAVEEADPTASQPLTREEAQQRLLAAGKLSTVKYAPEGAIHSNEEESKRLADLFSGGPITSLDIINEDRGEIGH